MKLYVVVKKSRNGNWNNCYLVTEVDNKDIVLCWEQETIMKLLDITYSQYYELVKTEQRKELN